MLSPPEEFYDHQDNAERDAERQQGYDLRRDKGKEGAKEVFEAAAEVSDLFKGIEEAGYYVVDASDEIVYQLADKIYCAADNGFEDGQDTAPNGFYQLLYPTENAALIIVIIAV